MIINAFKVRLSSVLVKTMNNMSNEEFEKSLRNRVTPESSSMYELQKFKLAFNDDVVKLVEQELASVVSIVADELMHKCDVKFTSPLTHGVEQPCGKTLLSSLIRRFVAVHYCIGQIDSQEAFELIREGLISMLNYRDVELIFYA